jgi:hypothetical protein
VLGPVRRRAVVQRVAHGGVGTGVEERFDRVEVPALGGVVEGGGAVAMLWAAECSAPVGVGAERDESQDRLRSPGRGGPGERRAAVHLGVNAGPAGDERLERLDSIVARRPREGLVEDLLPIVGGLPGRKAAVRAVEGAVSTGFRRERPVWPQQFVDQVEPPEAGGGTQVAREHAPLGQKLGDLPVPPEEGDDEWGSAVAARRHVGGRAGLEQ